MGSFVAFKIKPLLTLISPCRWQQCRRYCVGLASGHHEDLGSVLMTMRCWNLGCCC